jgi:hypothetical protein
MVSLAAVRCAATAITQHFEEIVVGVELALRIERLGGVLERDPVHVNTAVRPIDPDVLDALIGITVAAKGRPELRVDDGEMTGFDVDLSHGLTIDGHF